MDDRVHSPIPQDRPPAITLLWGWAGVAPFLMLAAVLLYGAPEMAGWAMQILVAYGAIILTFMGGVHWGIAFGQPQRNALFYSTGIAPSLVAVTALLVPADIALWLLSGGLVGLLAYDMRLVRRGFAPRWYGRLRLQLTAAVVACLLVVGILA
jgi:hypothetical protein